MESDREHDGDSGNGDSVDVATAHNCYSASATTTAATAAGEHLQAYTTLPLTRMRTFTTPNIANANTLGMNSQASGSAYTSLTVDPKYILPLNNCVSTGSNSGAYNGSVTLNRGVSSAMNLGLYNCSKTLGRSENTCKTPTDASFV